MADLESSEIARLFYLSLLVMVLLSSLVVIYRDRLGQALQHIAIWGLILIGVVLAYGFKDHLTAVIMPDQGLELDDRSLSFFRAVDGHFYATLKVNGEDVMFLIDTGATNLVLTRRAAAAAGIDVDNLSYFLKAKTANGIVSGAPVTLTWVALGSFQDRNVSAVVNGGELHTSLLGMSYLKRFQSFRIEGDRMILVR